MNKNSKIKVNLIEFNCFCFITQGVYKGRDGGRCIPHSVLVVRYGTLDGEDFWLIKNSFGPNGGIGGYVRL
jgi:hypothetical protein